MVFVVADALAPDWSGNLCGNVGQGACIRTFNAVWCRRQVRSVKPVSVVYYGVTGWVRQQLRYGALGVIVWAGYHLQCGVVREERWLRHHHQSGVLGVMGGGVRTARARPHGARRPILWWLRGKRDQLRPASKRGHGMQASLGQTIVAERSPQLFARRAHGVRCAPVHWACQHFSGAC